jgi:hypothetical protein
MGARTLNSPPSILPLYARAAAPMIPGASLLPFVPGRGGEIPEIELELNGVRPDPEKIAAYAKVCGFALRDHLPPTYPHALAFPLHMAVMADGGFPFGAVGLVHVENRIVQHRRIGVGEELTIRVRPTKLESHPKGRTFSLVTEASVDSETAWESTSTMLRRGTKKPADGTKSSSTRGRGCGVEAWWRFGAALRRRVWGPQPDSHALAERQGAWVPAGDRARDVDQGALPGRAREHPARCLRRRGAFPQADPAPRQGRVRQHDGRRGNRLRGT